jgi:cytoskeletal protein CcmA (bactofilin family)
MELEQINYSYLGEFGLLKGEIRLFGPTYIECEVQGHLEVLDDSLVTLGRKSRLQGTLHCTNLEVFGRVEGTLRVAETLTLHPSAIVQGEVIAKNLIIRPGAKVTLQVDVGDEVLQKD